MITADILKSKNPKLDQQKAENIAFTIDLLATKYKIDNSQILKLLDKNLMELETEIKDRDESRKQLKRQVRETILGANNLIVL